jgi:vacuolar-type H+-ATPase subunit I/STV1
MVAALIGALPPLVYLAIGFAAAAWDAPALHERLKYSCEYADKAAAARGWSVITLFLWPIRVPCLLVIRMTDKKNPTMIARELRRREEEVRDRERAVAKAELQREERIRERQRAIRLLEAELDREAQKRTLGP